MFRCNGVLPSQGLQRQHQRASKREKYSDQLIGQELLPEEANPKLALLQKIGGSKLLSVLDQLGNFVGEFFDLLGSLAWAPYRERNCHSNELILRSDSIMRVNESADGPTSAETWPGVQRYMKCFSVRSVEYRRVPGESNKCLPAVFTLVGVSLQRNTPVAGVIVEGRYQKTTLKARRWVSGKSHFLATRKHMKPRGHGSQQREERQWREFPPRSSAR